MNRADQKLSWKDRAMAYEMDQDIESPGTGARDNGMSVIWASSQGGCGPLKQLLKNVEEPALPPPTQPHPGLPSSTVIKDASPFQALSQSSTSSLSSRSSNISNGTSQGSSGSSSRVPRRTRSAHSRTISVSSKGVTSPIIPSARGTKPGLSNTSEISNVLSRVSRSLNERAMSEYSLSQRQRMQQTRGTKTPPSHRMQSQTHILPPRISQSGPARSSSGPDPPSLPGPSSTQAYQDQIMAPSSSTAPLSHHTTAITDSPRKGRIKALLETIDHASPFPSPSPSSTPSASHAGSKQKTLFGRSRPQPATHDKMTLPAPPRKTPALGMRRPVLHSALPTALVHAPYEASNLSSSHRTSKSPPSLKSPSESLIHDTEPVDSANIMEMEEDKSLRHHETEVTLSPHRGRKWKNLSRGYRDTTPDSPSPSRSLSLLEEDTHMSEELDDRYAQPREGGASDTRSYDQDLDGEYEAAGEDNDAHMSDGASSGNSSYGDMGIDAAALEEACKAYDA